MPYVVVGGVEKIAKTHKGLYCRFLDLKDGRWNRCRWGLLSAATIFSTAEEAQQIILNALDWARCCDAKVAQIHPMNLSCT